MGKCPKCDQEYTGTQDCPKEDCFFETMTDYRDPNSDLYKTDFGFVDQDERQLTFFKHKRFSMKKAFKWLKGVITADNKAGEMVHGVLDLLPIPNQVVAKGVKYLLAGQKKEAKEELGKLLSVRNGVALLLCIAYFAGLITLDDVKALLEALGQFL